MWTWTRDDEAKNSFLYLLCWKISSVPNPAQPKGKEGQLVCIMLTQYPPYTWLYIYIYIRMCVCMYVFMYMWINELYETIWEEETMQHHWQRTWVSYHNKTRQWTKAWMVVKDCQSGLGRSATMNAVHAFQSSHFAIFYVSCYWPLLSVSLLFSLLAAFVGCE